MRWVLVAIVAFLVSVTLASALIDFVPSNNIDMRSRNITNATKVCYADGSCSLSAPAGGTSNLTLLQIATNVGNWSSDKTSYNTITQANAKFLQNQTCINGYVQQNSTTSGSQCVPMTVDTNNGGVSNLTLDQVSTNVGNWSADKPSYFTATQSNAKFLANMTCASGYVLQNATSSGSQCVVDQNAGGTSNLTLAQVATNIGNWSLDKPNYYNTTQINTLGNYSANVLGFYNTTTLVVPLQSSAAGWTNTTTQTSTLLDANITGKLFVGNTTSEFMRLNGSGALGLGTTSPTATLDVRALNTGTRNVWLQATAGQTTDILGAGTSSGDVRGGIDSNGWVFLKRGDVADNSGPNLNFYKAGNASGGYSAVANGAVLGGEQYSGYNGGSYIVGAKIQAVATQGFNSTGAGTRLDFYTTTNNSFALTNRVTISDAGYLGIGTNTPVQRVDVRGGVSIVANGAISGLGSTPLNRGLVVTGTSGFDRVYFEANDSTSGQRVFAIDNGAGVLTFNSLSDDASSWNNQNILSITNAGRVGIRTVSPTQALDVNGSINVSGNAARLYLPTKSTISVGNGSNACVGQATLVGGNTLVNTTCFTSLSDAVLLTRQAGGGTIGIEGLSARVAGVSFNITSTNVSDTSTVAWFIVDTTG